MKFKKLFLKDYLDKALFFITLIFSHSVVNLYYDSSSGQDFEKYNRYLKYFSGDLNSTNLEQNPIYYFYVSKIMEMNSEKNIFNSYESLVSFSIQSTNYLIYIVGLIGLYKLLKLYEVEISNIYLSLSLLNFFPPMIGLRMTMKPEILSFSILIWIIYFIEMNLKYKNQKYFYSFIFLFGFVLTLKLSVTAMLSIFLAFVYYKDYLKINKKLILSGLLLLSIIFSLLQYESYQFNDKFVYEAEHDSKYNNKASPSIIYKINPIKLFKEPYEDKHKDSMMSILLLDTFDDYFNLYWNYDKGLLEKNEKVIITTNTSDKLIEIDSFNKTINYSGPFNFYTRFIKQYLSILLTLFFIFASIRYKGKHKKFIYSPLIGIIVLIINNVLGIPSNNFDPNRADTFKTFYIAIFLSLSFIFINILLLKVFGKYRYIYILIFIFLILFIFGLPLANNSDLDASLSKNNSLSIFCEINYQFLNSTLFENDNLTCNRSESNIVNLYEIKNVPYINVLFSFLIIGILLFEIISQFKIRK